MYRHCPACGLNFVTNRADDKSETFRHNVRTGERHPHKRQDNGPILWADRQTVWRGCLWAIYWDLRLGGVVDEATRELVELCR